MSKKTKSGSAGDRALGYIEGGLDAKKCRRCGKMAGVIERAERAFEGADDPMSAETLERIRALKARLGKPASDDFGCGGCWGSKARKELARALKPRKFATKSAGPGFAIEVVEGEIRCHRIRRSGRASKVVQGPDAAAIVAALAGSQLLRRGESAAYLGWELARAEAALATGEPYEARPWG